MTMQSYVEEVDANFQRFFDGFSAGIGGVVDELGSKSDKFKLSYRRLVSLNAWRSELIESTVRPDVEQFFREAHNDALMSHCLARQGAWRVALMSLRSCIENTLFGLYYIDHPIELRKWDVGQHKLGFTEAIDYLSKHPDFSSFEESDVGVDVLRQEYATLSKAVHGSAHSFRMTKSGEAVGLNVSSFPELGSWESREKKVLYGINLVLLVFFRPMLQGASNVPLRKAISLVINNVTKQAAIKAKFDVALRS